MADDGVLILDPALAAELREAAEDLGYAGAAEVVREAFDGWKQRRLQARAALADLRSMIDAADEDLEAGRLHDLDMEAIIREAREELAHS